MDNFDETAAKLAGDKQQEACRGRKTIKTGFERLNKRHQEPKERTEETELIDLPAKKGLVG